MQCECQTVIDSVLYVHVVAGQLMLMHDTVVSTLVVSCLLFHYHVVVMPPTAALHSAASTVLPVLCCIMSQWLSVIQLYSLASWLSSWLLLTHTLFSLCHSVSSC